MACDLVFVCDYCCDEVRQQPLAGQHPEARVWVRYPEGWSFDSDGDALCQACTEIDAIAMVSEIAGPDEVISQLTVAAVRAR